MFKKIANNLEILPIALLLGLFLASNSQIASAQEYKKNHAFGAHPKQYVVAE